MAHALKSYARHVQRALTLSSGEKPSYQAILHKVEHFMAAARTLATSKNSNIRAELVELVSNDMKRGAHR